MSYDLDVELDRSALDDDQLAMLFTCCHPALTPDVRMALTLRSVAGLTVPEIARAFVSSESAMERRLVRARRKVTDARIPFRVPGDDLLPARLDGVLRVVYLVFTEGHVSTRSDAPVRGELCEEAIRLARLLVRLMPDEVEAHGLLALLLLSDARRPARVDAAGDLVALEDQDRGRWDAERITEGVGVLERALRLPRPRRLRHPGGDRVAARPGARLAGHRLAADRRALRRARTPRRLAGCRRQPRGRRRVRRGSRGRPCAARRPDPRQPPRALPAAARRTSRPAAPRRRCGGRGRRLCDGDRPLGQPGRARGARARHAAVRPPSMTSPVPVMKAAALEAR
jgi:hypothetical protein